MWKRSAAVVLASACLSASGLAATRQPAAAASGSDELHRKAHRVAVQAWRDMNYKQRFAICWQLDKRPRQLGRSIKRAAREPGGAFAGLNRTQQVIVWRAARDVFKERCD